MENIRKRDFWSDREIQQMLSIINEKHILQLIDGKPKRNKSIFVDIAKELKKNEIVKSDVQIRNKFKSLKSDFYKAKRNNNIKGAKRQTSEHFELLDEILGHHNPALKTEDADVDEMDAEEIDNMVSDYEEPTQTTDMLDHCATVKTEVVDVVEMDAADVDNIPTPSEEPKTDEEENPFISSEVNEECATSSKTRSFKRTKKNNYQKVVETFTRDWKESQQDLLKTMKKQDEKLLDLQMRRQEKILNRSLKTMEKILEKDREETAKMLQDFLDKISSSNPSSSKVFKQ